LLDRRRISKSAGVPLAVSANGQLVAIPCGNLLLVYDLQRLMPCFQCTADGFECHSVAFSPDGRVLCVGLNQWPILLLDANSGDQVGTLSGHQLGAKALAFSADGRTLASIGGDSTLRLWHVATRQELYVLHHSDRSVLWSIAFSPNDRQLVAVTATREGHGQVIAFGAR
jgi:WD40 repeat protein